MLSLLWGWVGVGVCTEVVVAGDKGLIVGWGNEDSESDGWGELKWSSNKLATPLSQTYNILSLGL